MVKVGDIVWAKLRGYPWWPAKVESIANVPEQIKTTEKDSIPVFFFGSKDYALINNDSIKPFDEENWLLFKGKCSAPKFKAALVEARKLTRQTQPEAPVKSKNKAAFPAEAVVKKRGRPKKIDLLKLRRQLQALLFSGNTAKLDEVMAILQKIASAGELQKEACQKSKLGVLLKTAFNSSQYKMWHTYPELLLLVQQVAQQIIKATNA